MRLLISENPWGYDIEVSEQGKNLIRISHWTPHEGGELYYGPYLGDSTPYMQRIKEDSFRVYNKIHKYFSPLGR